MDDQRVLVTAGAAGIGREIVRAFAAGGAAVFVCDLDAKGLRALAEEIAGLDLAGIREMDRSRGQMYSLVTMPKATKLISTLSPNTAGGVMEPPHAHRDNCYAEFCT